jgi:hypothetical protein
MNNLVFLTYSFKDLRRVRRLRDALRRHGLHVWPDKTLTPGTPAWNAEVHDRLAEAVCVLAILSKDAEQSSWLLQAVSDARLLRIPVLPVVIDGEAAHPMLFRLEGDDWYDLRWSKNYGREVGEMVTLIRQLVQAQVAEA